MKTKPLCAAALTAVLACVGAAPATAQFTSGPTLTAPAAPAALFADAATVTGAACAPGQGVTVVVDFSPIRDELEIRCAPGASGSIGDAFLQAGFALAPSLAWVTVIDGADATTLGYEGFWALYTSTADGTPAGATGTEWKFAQVGADGAHVQADQAYLFRLLDSWDCMFLDYDPDYAEQMDDPSVCVPQPPLDQVVARDGSQSVSPPPRETAAPPNAAAAAGWLVAQLTASGGVFETGSATDWGLTIDAVLALAAAGVGADAAASAARELWQSGDAYIGAAADIATKWPAVAKTALALQVAGLPPATFPAGPGYRNLIVELRGVQNADGSFGTGDTAFTHSLALIALARTDGGVPPVTVDWLVAQRCDDPDNADFGSFGWVAGCGAPDQDATAMAIQGLVAAGLASAPLHDAVQWLASKQDVTTGGFPSSFGGPNTNTTGLAVNSLRLAGAADAGAALGAAAAFVGGFTVACADVSAAGSVLTLADVGAIAFDAAGLADAAEFGLDSANTDQFRRATSQALLALDAPGLVDLTLAGAEPAAPGATCDAAPPTPGTEPSDGSGATGATPTDGGSGAADQLPLTGAQARGMGLAAALLVTAGVALAALRRRRSATLER
ncbi:MAG: hypothetical protein LBD97_03645 [Bifidobacteriaceae bacterium]|jgi:hypothetical protein|nr:hypothetical protein [Bifidobacteriaceae bacterium]